MRGNSLEAGEQSRSPPWVFLSGLRGSRHNSLNWFSLLHVEDRAAESQRDFFFSLLWVKGSKDFPPLSQQRQLFSPLFTFICQHHLLIRSRLKPGVFERRIAVKDWLREHFFDLCVKSVN